MAISAPFEAAYGHWSGRVAAMRGAAGDVDDLAAALRAELRDRQLAELRRRGEVDLHHPRPGRAPGLGRRVHRDGLEDAGIVDQHVDARRRFARLPPQRRGGIRIGEIRCDQAAAPGPDLALDRLGRRAIAAIVQHDLGPGRGHRADDGGADAARSAGHQDRLALELTHAHPLIGTLAVPLETQSNRSSGSAPIPTHG
jgi:hypothetical protein